MGKTNKILKKIAYCFGRFLPDGLYLRIRYRISFGKKLNLKKPTTYNEKLQWMKLYDRNRIYTTLVDKYEVKEYVRNIIGNEHIIPTLGVWDNFNDINFELLPNQFVLKCTHDSGSVKICKNKDVLDKKEYRKHFNKRLRQSEYIGGREWAYKGVKPRIIAEPFMADDSLVGMKDYKFFCFNGDVKFMFIATDRGVKGQDVKFDFFDKDFNHLPFKHGHKNAINLPEKPEHFDKMIEMAELLSKGLRHVRVDLYNCNGKIYFGEMTFYHHCGFVPFDPPEWDNIIGKYLDVGGK